MSSRCLVPRCPVGVALGGQYCSAHRPDDPNRPGHRCIGKRLNGAKCFMRVRGPRGFCKRHRSQASFSKVWTEALQLQKKADRLMKLALEIKESLEC